MEFRIAIFLQLIFLGLATLESHAADYGLLLDDQDDCICTCEPVTAEICKMEYKRTTFPNKVNGFNTQTDALKEFSSFPIESPTLQICSSMLKPFLCSYYFPPCVTTFNCGAVGPCNTLCEQVRGSCEPLLLKHNHTWPDHLDCTKFPTSTSADPHCIPGTPPTDITLKPACEKVKQPICSSLHPDYMTQFPNKHLITQDEADIQFNTFVPALSSNCSSMLRVLLCTSHYPICTDGSIRIYPCKHICEQVQQSCEPALLQHNVSFVWPEFLNCNNFPSKNESVCADSMFAAPSTPTPSAPTNSSTTSNLTSPSTSSPNTSTPSTSTPSKSTPSKSTIKPPTASAQDTCEPILPEVLEICGGIHPNYGMTHFPYGGFKCQRQAIETLKNTTEFLQYLELMDRNCAPELKPFLCLHFFPMCSPTQPIKIIKPCRSVCRKATNGCSSCADKWPFDCNDYKVKGNCLSLNDLKHYIRRFSAKESKC